MRPSTLPLDKALKRTSNAIGFLFFIFDLEYLIRVQSSVPLYAKMNPTTCLLTGNDFDAGKSITGAGAIGKGGGGLKISTFWARITLALLVAILGPKKS